eukprot:3505106-Rhodomonas_salina.1
MDVLTSSSTGRQEDAVGNRSEQAGCGVRAAPQLLAASPDKHRDRAYQKSAFSLEMFHAARHSPGAREREQQLWPGEAG